MTVIGRKDEGLHAHAMVVGDQFIVPVSTRFLDEKDTLIVFDKCTEVLGIQNVKNSKAEISVYSLTSTAVQNNAVISPQN
ncbi:hypothetical protein KIN20_033763 [Parelaphostrongylus tenuis]|uniref:Uncharacterized protein n=1 Tax=Parelaphostrongylus tenuis TaxID=148309 RepID=A0AAD5R987_PARTN|nr:hypothetical protein KIN20_033763 [Parelaphostrongylus tenuis]